MKPPVLHCGGLSGQMHGPHEWRWRRTVIPPDLTGETTPYRQCPGSDAVCSFKHCPSCGVPVADSVGVGL